MYHLRDGLATYSEVAPPLTPGVPVEEHLTNQEGKDRATFTMVKSRSQECALFLKVSLTLKSVMLSNFTNMVKHTTTYYNNTPNIPKNPHLSIILFPSIFFISDQHHLTLNIKNFRGLNTHLSHSSTNHLHSITHLCTFSHS